jgi:hypothetical protein
MKRLKIGTDIDDVLAEFLETYLKRFGNPKNDWEITRNVQRVLIKDKDFWENLPVINTLNFIPELYCTKRVNSKVYTKNWLKKHNFPNKPIYQVICQTRNKADFIKGKVDVFIDDSITNFIQMNLAGVPCLLYNKKYNQHWGPIGRIYSLDYNEIEQAYVDFMEVFPNFKRLYDDFK